MGKISDYTRVLLSKLTDVLAVDQTDNGTTETKSATVEQIGTAIGTLQNFADLDTSNKNLVDAINEIASYTPVYGNTASGAIATFDTSLALPLQDCTIAINAVQESGTPTPSSPKAISGFTGANIKVVGKNLINFLSDLKSSSNGLSISIDNGGIKFVNQPTASWADLSNTINVFLPKGTYTFSRTTSATYNVYIDVIFEDSTTATMSITSGTTSRTATYTKNIVGIKLHLSGLSTSTTYSETIYLQFEEGSTATAYHPYNANSTTTAITWQSVAGTVYGGSLDVTSGVLTVTWTKKLMSTWTWSYNDTDYSYGYFVIPSNVADMSDNMNFICDFLAGVKVGRGSLGNNELGAYNATTSNRRLCARADSITDINSWNTFIADKYVAYELATPVTYQLTPTQISAIVGTNNVFTDTNGNTSVVYACSLKDYIEGQ